MNTTTRGRYRKPRNRNPFYILAALAALGLLLLAGACSDTTDDDAPDDFPVNAERRSSGDAAPEPAPEPDPVVDEAMSDDEIAALAFQMTFESMSAAELADVCTAVDMFGMDGAIDLAAEGYGAGWQPSYRSLLADILRERC